MALNLTQTEGFALCELLHGSSGEDLIAETLALELDDLATVDAKYQTWPFDARVLAAKVRGASQDELRTIRAAAASFWGNADIPPEEALQQSGILEV
jgi:hypothetical protein